MSVDQGEEEVKATAAATAEIPRPTSVVVCVFSLQFSLPSGGLFVPSGWLSVYPWTGVSCWCCF